jgi:hypothetical protein
MIINRFVVAVRCCTVAATPAKLVGRPSNKMSRIASLLGWLHTAGRRQDHIRGLSGGGDGSDPVTMTYSTTDTTKTTTCFSLSEKKESSRSWIRSWEHTSPSSG